MSSPNPEERHRLTARVLMNVKSGRGTAEVAPADVAKALSGHGIDARIERLKPEDDIVDRARRAAESGVDMVIAAGGDGTMNGVAAALAGGDTPMGILPLGTFNYFARSLGIPEDLDGACGVLARNRPAMLDVGMINDALFLNNASLGIYPMILRKRETIYARWGRSRIAAYWSVLGSIVRPPRPLDLRIEANGETIHVSTALVFAACNAFQLEQLGLDGSDCVRQGKLAILIAPDSGRLQLVRHALALALGQAESGRDFRMICADSALITTRRRTLLVARDGERQALAAPFRLELRHAALAVIAPSPEERGEAA